MSDETAGSPVLIAATALECKALQRAMPEARIVQTGIALGDLHDALGEVVISCGLAGGLRPELATGTLVIPREVGRPDGSRLRCDDELVERLTASARRLGIEPIADPLLTSETIVTGETRAHWAARGYAAVDMETGILDAPRVAAVRVILDTPQYEISEDWRTPMLAILKPWNWPQAMWLAREAPRASMLAARVVAGAQGIAGKLRITRQ